MKQNRTNCFSLQSRRKSVVDFFLGHWWLLGAAMFVVKALSSFLHVVFRIKNIFHVFEHFLIYIRDSIVSAFYPIAWNFESKSQTIGKHPKHVMLAGQINPSSRKKYYTSLNRLALLASGCMSLGVKQVSLFLSDEYWNIQYLNELNAHISKQFTKLGESVIISQVTTNPKTSYFKQYGKKQHSQNMWNSGNETSDPYGLDDGEIYSRKIVIVGPCCKRGVFSEADNVIYLQDRRNSTEGFVEMLQQSVKSMENTENLVSIQRYDSQHHYIIGTLPTHFTRETVLKYWPGDVPSRPGIDKDYIDDVDLLICFGDSHSSISHRSGFLQDIPAVALRYSEIAFTYPLYFSTARSLYRILRRYGHVDQRHGA